VNVGPAELGWVIEAITRFLNDAGDGCLQPELLQAEATAARPLSVSVGILRSNLRIDYDRVQTRCTIRRKSSKYSASAINGDQDRKLGSGPRHSDLPLNLSSEGYHAILLDFGRFRRYGARKTRGGT
jgi:hypothetical protein